MKRMGNGLQCQEAYGHAPRTQEQTATILHGGGAAACDRERHWCNHGKLLKPSAQCAKAATQIAWYWSTD
jgi:hypothetical protein